MKHIDWIDSLDADHKTLINCIAKKLCLNLNRVLHRRGCRLISGMTNQRLEIISNLQSELKVFQDGKMGE